jgi:hypothetical protein
VEEVEPEHVDLEPEKRLEILESKLEDLRNQKHKLFLLLKQILSEDERKVISRTVIHPMEILLQILLNCRRDLYWRFNALTIDLQSIWVDLPSKIYLRVNGVLTVAKSIGCYSIGIESNTNLIMCL